MMQHPAISGGHTPRGLRVSQTLVTPRRITMMTLVFQLRRLRRALNKGCYSIHTLQQRNIIRGAALVYRAVVTSEHGDTNATLRHASERRGDSTEAPRTMTSWCSRRVIATTICAKTALYCYILQPRETPLILNHCRRVYVDASWRQHAADFDHTCTIRHHCLLNVEHRYDTMSSTGFSYRGCSR